MSSDSIKSKFPRHVVCGLVALSCLIVVLFTAEWRPAQDHRQATLKQQKGQDQEEDGESFIESTMQKQEEEQQQTEQLQEKSWEAPAGLQQQSQWEESQWEVARHSRHNRPKGSPSYADRMCERACPNCNFTFKGDMFDFRTDHLLMFNYGKVASESLRWSFSRTVLMHKAEVRRRQPQVIYLTTGGNPVQERSDVMYLNPEDTKPVPRFAKTHAGEVAKLYLSRVPAGKRVWIVTAVRSPFTFLVSLFFEDFKGKLFPWQKNATDGKDVGVETMMSHFIEESAKKDAQYWFSWSHFLPNIGLDISACGDRFRDGSLYIDRWQGGVRQTFVLIRKEDIKKWGPVLAKYFPGFGLVKTFNLRTDNSFTSVADEFDKRWVWREEDVRRILRWDSWEFYTAEERMNMIKELQISVPFKLG